MGRFTPGQQYYITLVRGGVSVTAVTTYFWPYKRRNLECFCIFNAWVNNNRQTYSCFLWLFFFFSFHVSRGRASIVFQNGNTILLFFTQNSGRSIFFWCFLLRNVVNVVRTNTFRIVQIQNLVWKAENSRYSHQCSDHVQFYIIILGEWVCNFQFSFNSLFR